MKHFTIKLAVLFSFSLIGCNNNNKVNESIVEESSEIKVSELACDAPAIDRSKTITIESQTWMVHNLNVDTFRNGDLIMEARNKKEWEEAGINGIPAWCYYHNNPCNAKYGKLYNFHAIEDERGLAPEGWHIPTDEEWLKLNYFIKEDIAYKLKSKDGWFEDGNGNNETGFQAFPNGIRYYDGEFMYYGEHAFFWTASSCIINHAWLRHLDYNYSDRIFRTKAKKSAGMAVRCVKDYETN